MEQLSNPHDSFFRFAMSHIHCVRALIALHMDRQTLELLDLESLKLETDSFVDANLSKRFSDLVFSVQLHPPSIIDGQRYIGDELKTNEAIVCFLFEHKSEYDKNTAIQLLGYVLRICEKRLRDGLPLIPIIPLVIYHGTGPWSAPRCFSQLISGPECLSRHMPEFCYPLLDLSQLDERNLGGESVLKSVLLLLKYSRDVMLIRHLSMIFAGFAAALNMAILDQHQLKQWLSATERYVMATNSNIDEQQYKQTLASVFPTQFEPGSVVDRVLTEGIEKGLEKGRQQGHLVCKIQLTQTMLGEPESSEKELYDKEVSELKTILDSLEMRLKDRSGKP